MKKLLPFALIITTLILLSVKKSSAACPLGDPAYYTTGSGLADDYTNWNTASDGNGNLASDQWCADTLVIQQGDTMTLAQAFTIDAVLVVNGMLQLTNDLILRGDLLGTGTIAGNSSVSLEGSSNQRIQMDQAQTFSSVTFHPSSYVTVGSPISIANSLDIVLGEVLIENTELSLAPDLVMNFCSDCGIVTTSNESKIHLQEVAEGDTIELQIGKTLNQIRNLKVIGEFGTTADGYTISAQPVVDQFKPHQLTNDSAFVDISWTITEDNTGGGNLSLVLHWTDMDMSNYAMNNIVNLNAIHKDPGSTLQSWPAVPNQTPSSSGNDFSMVLSNEASPFGHYVIGVDAQSTLPPAEIAAIETDANIAGGNVLIGVKTLNTDLVNNPPEALFIDINGTQVNLAITVISADSLTGSGPLACDVVSDNYDLTLALPAQEPIVAPNGVFLINNLLATINGPDSICADAIPQDLVLQASGGTIPYSYLWSTGTTDATHPGGSYSVTVTDNNGCEATASHVAAAFSTTDNSLTGEITIDGTVVNTGEVSLYKIQSGLWSLLHSTNINSDGSYDFDGLSDGEFILLARPDSSTYPGSGPTYFEQTNYWDSAKVMSINCQTQKVANIEILQPAVIDAGSGVIRGSILDNSTTKVAGDPMPGLDVVLVKIPPTTIVATTLTDDEGNYQFDNLPEGDYEIQVLLPGATQTTTWNVTLSEESMVAEDIDYLVDTTGFITKASFANVGLESLYQENNATIFPQPASEWVNINWESETTRFTIEDISGKVLQSGILIPGINIIDVNAFPTGSYFLRAEHQLSRLQIR